MNISNNSLFAIWYAVWKLVFHSKNECQKKKKNNVRFSSEFTAADLTSMQFTLLSTFYHHLFTFTFEHLQIFNLHRAFYLSLSLSFRPTENMNGKREPNLAKKPLQFVIMVCDTDASERKMRHFNYKVNDDDIRRRKKKCHRFQFLLVQVYCYCRWIGTTWRHIIAYTAWCILHTLE